MLREYKNLKWLWGADWKFHHSGYCSASQGFRVMPSSYLSDRIFNPQLTTIMDSFSCIHFLRKLSLNFHMRYYINVTLKYLPFRSKHDRFSFYLRCWRQNVWRKMTSKSDMIMSKLTCDIKKTPWHHAWESCHIPHVRWHFLAQVRFMEIPVVYARKSFSHPTCSEPYGCRKNVYWHLYKSRAVIHKVNYVLHQAVTLWYYQRFFMI